MSLIFCSNCGNKSEYQFSPPNFCSKCGTSYSSRFGVKKTKSSIKDKSQNSSSEEEYFEEINDSSEDEDFFSNSTRIPIINSIKVDIESYSNIRVVKMSDIVNGNSSEDKLKLGARKDINELLDEK
jgi:hypothetical protein